MASIADQMRKLGLVTEGQARQEDARRLLEKKATAKRNRKRTDVVDESDLHGCKNVRRFRNVARRFLLQNPDQIRVVISAAHSYNDRRLVGQLYGLRDNLRAATPEKHAQIINRALRGAGRRHNRDV